MAVADISFDVWATASLSPAQFMDWYCDGSTAVLHPTATSETSIISGNGRERVPISSVASLAEAPLEALYLIPRVKDFSANKGSGRPTALGHARWLHRS